MRTVTVSLGNGGWWARIEKPGAFMVRGPYPFYWMATLAFPIQRWTWCLAISVFAGALLFGHHTHALSSFPSVRELQNELRAHPGDAIAKLVPCGGVLCLPRYVAGYEAGQKIPRLGAGEYAVIIKLERNR